MIFRKYYKKLFLVLVWSIHPSNSFLIFMILMLKTLQYVWLHSIEVSCVDFLRKQFDWMIFFVQTIKKILSDEITTLSLVLKFNRQMIKKKISKESRFLKKLLHHIILLLNVASLYFHYQKTNKKNFSYKNLKIKTNNQKIKGGYTTLRFYTDV